MTIRSDGFEKAYADGAQLYRCEIEGPQRLAPLCAGRCRREGDDFMLVLFHHTNAAAHAGIVASGELWGSAWNLQGTRRLANVASVYLTSLSGIRSQGDLHRIAMASDGRIRFQTTSDRPTEDVLSLEVYRGSTKGRSHTVEVVVPSADLAPPHLLFHPNVGSKPAWYETIGPEIFRVALRPGATLPIPRGRAAVRPGDLKVFDHSVMGDASTTAGLAAPYDEEGTSQVMRHDPLDAGLDLFETWMATANTDLVSGHAFEGRIAQA